MPEEQKKAASAPEQPGYYKTTGRKVTDFLLGFLGYPVLISWGGLMLSRLRYPNLGSYALAAAALLALGFCFYAVQMGRKYIAIGIVSSIIIPLLFIGGCMMVMYGEK